MSNTESTAASNSDQGRPYNTKATGEALKTVEAHQDDQVDITLFGSCFCPFVQRVWVMLEALEIPYKVSIVEVDPYKKPKELLELSPKGLVPALKLNNFTPPRALNESTVIMDYLEDLAESSTKKTALPLPFNPYARALARLAADQACRSLVPAFYRYLQAQDVEKQTTAGREFQDAIDVFIALLGRAENEILGPGRVWGLWVEGNTELGWADIMAAPWLFRAKVVLGHYRGYKFAPGDRVQRYLERVFEHPHFKATCSDEKLYYDSYERYAFNRPNTSQVATAINEGRALP
ncbi:glutathione S-transferase [Ephemerocybe angulata]|uniref:Glutathione S-transferase n=1 Tax=Ephemerocybe angulata TaxID=980116 RepID=A0A8H6IB58_9AGAR|nr:glutathione S-transferase [Tulosesus angulatus]